MCESLTDPHSCTVQEVRYVSIINIYGNLIENTDDILS